MAGQLLLVNPGKRRRRKTAGRKRRRTRRTMTAKQARYFAPRKRRRARSAPARRRSRSRRRYANPVRRHRRRARHVARRSYRRGRRRNPIMGGFIGGAVMEAVQGAAGAIVADAVWNFVPLPATLKTGPVGLLAKAGGTIALGMIASKVVGSGMAKKGTVGALTVQLYSYAKPMLAGVIPGLAGVGYYGAGYSLNGVGAFVPNSLSDIPNSLNRYISGDEDEDTANFPGNDLSRYISAY